MFKSINICGYGYVGSSMGFLCQNNNVKYNVYDVQEKEGDFRYFSDLKEMIKHSETINNNFNVYFICVPTPQGVNNKCDISIVSELVDEIVRCSTNTSIIIIKSTVQPGTTRSLYNKYLHINPKVKFYFCPEFLREKSAHQDILQCNDIIIGSSSGKQETFASVVIRELYGANVNLVFKEYTTIELYKYTVNNFLATKVWFFNKVSQVCDKLSVDYNDLKELFFYDKRLGNSHFDVPGPDGLSGFGGSCFTKEYTAMIYLMGILNIDNKCLKDIIEENSKIRNNLT